MLWSYLDLAAELVALNMSKPTIAHSVALLKPRHSATK